MSARGSELAENLAALNARLQSACLVAGRDPATVSLLPVTKYFPASDVGLLHALGLRDFGESREQEASAKVSELGLLEVRWHMIGRLQRNKVRAVAKWAYAVHSVDSVRLARALDVAVRAELDTGVRTQPLAALVQVSLDGDPQRGGVSVNELESVADVIARSGVLRLAGLMAVPPLGGGPDAAEAAFAQLATVQAGFLRIFPGATELSAGMSGDLEHAIAYGSTRVRVGTALMGARPLMSEL